MPDHSREDLDRTIAAALTASLPDPLLSSICRRCKRPRLEHEPFSLPSEWAVCEDFMEAT